MNVFLHYMYSVPLLKFNNDEIKTAKLRLLLNVGILCILSIVKVA